MSLNKAFEFYNLFRTNIDFRKECCTCNSKDELKEFFEHKNLLFSDEEFNEVISSSLFKCQTEEDALAVRQIEQAYCLLIKRMM